MNEKYDNLGALPVWIGPDGTYCYLRNSPQAKQQRQGRNLVAHDTRLAHRTLNVIRQFRGKSR